MVLCAVPRAKLTFGTACAVSGAGGGHVALVHPWRPRRRPHRPSEHSGSDLTREIERLPYTHTAAAAAATTADSNKE
eukprot:3148125-Rhodomonas_salina.1